MAEPYVITGDMRGSRAEMVDRITRRVNASIQHAAAMGLHECYFPCDRESYNDAPFYKEVRERFERSGYRVKPTGFIGGVWQRSENIEW